MKILVGFLFFILFNRPANARLDFEDAAYPEFVTSARALAMGNAYINKVDDSWSAFYNPAGLGTVRKPQFHILNAHAEVGNNYSDSSDLQKLRTKLAKHQGKLAHSRINFFPNITVRGLTLGYMYTQRNRGIINKDVANKFEVAERKDQGPVMALNASLFGGVFKVGASAVYLNRRELYKAFSPTEPVTIVSNDYRSGKGLQLTAGARVTLPYSWIPTFSAVLRNTTNNNWEDIKKGGAPADIEQTIDGGISITPQIGKISRLHLEVNMRDIKNAYVTNPKRRLAAGMELDFNRRIFLRAGSGDGWGSGGIGVRARTFILDITTYAVDRSLEGFREKEDRRWVLSLSSGF